MLSRLLIKLLLNELLADNFKKGQSHEKLDERRPWGSYQGISFFTFLIAPLIPAKSRTPDLKGIVSREGVKSLGLNNPPRISVVVPNSFFSDSDTDSNILTPNFSKWCL
jgi:hypothetical protein